MSQRNEELKEAMTSYAERLRMVRKLSAPSLEEVASADDYSRLLLHNFRKIGELAGENAEVLNKILMPFIQGEETLSEDEASELDTLNELLIDPNYSDILDTHLAEMINTRLNESEEELTEGTSGDPNQRVHDLNRRMRIRYERMGKCWYAQNYEESARIRKLAIEDYQELLKCLDKDAFLKLSPKARKTALRGIMFGVALYELEDPREMIRRETKQRELCSDPFIMSICLICRKMTGKNYFSNPISMSHEYVTTTNLMKNSIGRLMMPSASVRGCCRSQGVKD